MENIQIKFNLFDDDIKQICKNCSLRFDCDNYKPEYWNWVCMNFTNKPINGNNKEEFYDDGFACCD